MPALDIDSIITRNLTAVRSDMKSACDSVGRNPADVRLVAVTKYAEWQWVESLVKLHSTFGENRPQQLADRHEKLPTAEWHLIGQLQRNKAKQAVQSAELIHSIDSEKLLDRVAQVAQELQVRTNVLLQVNVSGEESKSGFTPENLKQAWTRLAKHQQHVNVTGLMTMAPAFDDAELTRPTFAGLRTLLDELNSQVGGPDWVLTELSMGMSGDFSVAIQEGATLVRIGSRLFEGLESG